MYNIVEETTMKNHYVYFLLDPRKPGLWTFEGKDFAFQPFYVGKGTGHRSSAHLTKSGLKRDPNQLKVETILKIRQNCLEPIVVKPWDQIDNQTSVEIEKRAISYFGRIFDDGILTNICLSDIETLANTVGGENVHSKKVYQYSLEGEFVKEWLTSCREVAKSIGVAQSTLSNACGKDKTTCAGFIWSYEYLGEKIDPLIPGDQSKRVKKVYKYCKYGELTHSYSSMKDAAIENKLDYSRLCLAIKKKKWYKDSFFSYNSDAKIPKKKLKFRKYKVKCLKTNKVCWMTNSEICKQFSCSNSYPARVYRKEHVSPKFEISDVQEYEN